MTVPIPVAERVRLGQGGCPQSAGFGLPHVLWVLPVGPLGLPARPTKVLRTVRCSLVSAGQVPAGVIRSVGRPCSRCGWSVDLFGSEGCTGH